LISEKLLVEIQVVKPGTPGGVAIAREEYDCG
jgi:hypothetical protein